MRDLIPDNYEALLGIKRKTKRQPSKLPDLGAVGQPLNITESGLAGNPDMASLCLVYRQLHNVLERLIRVFQGIPSENGETIVSEGISGDLGIGLLTEYFKFSLATYPSQHQTVAVGTSAQKIVTNSGQDPVAVMITNNSNAQILRYGSSTITGTIGATLDIEESVKVLVPGNTDLYGCFPTAASSVSVAKLVIPLIPT